MGKSPYSMNLLDKWAFSVQIGEDPLTAGNPPVSLGKKTHFFPVVSRSIRSL